MVVTPFLVRKMKKPAEGGAFLRACRKITRRRAKTNFGGCEKVVQVVVGAEVRIIFDSCEWSMAGSPQRGMKAG
jgi:hypothetical protein